MAVAVNMIHRENPMEERVARLETQYDHLREDVQRVERKIDQLDEKVERRLAAFESKFEQKLGALEQKFDHKLDALGQSLNGKIEAIQDALAKMALSRMADRVWQLLINAAMLGVMARGFKWI